MLSVAQNTIDFVGFRIIVHQNMSVIRDLIYRNVRVTFLLLNTNSSHVDTQSQIFVGAGDLKYSIKKSLELLCKEKQNLAPI